MILRLGKYENKLFFLIKDMQIFASAILLLASDQHIQ